MMLPLAAAMTLACVSPWQPDLGDGRYRNPVLYADYSDPDVVRVGDDYWLTASSFSCVPGLPLLHSRDLVNWTLAAHALPRLVPEEAFASPQPGKGVWAPAIRHHAGRFWIYYPDPDFGLYVITAADPRGPWSAPVLVQAGRGLIDPCPLWDEDGRVYLVHAWAKSRAGINNVLTLLRLDAGGTRVEEDLGVIVDGHALPDYSTLEGPKFYRRDGWYYIFAPAGGVKTGWQSVFRARDVRGPYEARIVLAQGSTAINGPHQGALVDTPKGEWWFVHFQDLDAYGRVVHLEPVVWREGWPVIGSDPDGDGRGEPVLTHRKPTLPPEPRATPPTSDAFDSPTLGLQWQWPANPREGWFSLTDRPGALRLHPQAAVAPLSLAPYLLLQKFPAPTFVVTTRLELPSPGLGQRAGLIVAGEKSAWMGLQRSANGVEIVRGGDPAESPAVVSTAPAATGAIFIRVTVREHGCCEFSFSSDGHTFSPLGGLFTAVPGRWIGAKVGLFNDATNVSVAGPADFAWFRVEPLP
ncbi:glycoside hydrolase 43 family protein [Horticoccus luteus]|uniref:Glycoside hydrolase 43 family protein n=1 Tax=Horticoccus luteus TaxID=2862869 RepID=A0A8F9TTE9_9BACT|nr:glycoside hydrolase 43 family protein [Horticoccus luteus]QYM77795.1 glycoside hydrolase 43 family protein [Horticoccus luteus]